MDIFCSTIPYLDIFFELLVHRSSGPDKITSRSQNTVQFQKQQATLNKVNTSLSQYGELKAQQVSILKENNNSVG